MVRDMPRPLSSLLALVLGGPLLACTDCEREGCDALNERAAAGQGAGLGGVIALESDFVQDGCAECPLGTATLSAWRLDGPVTNIDEAVAVVHARDPDLTQEVSGRYRLELDPAAYLICVRPECVAVDITAGATTTLNIKLREGPPSFFVDPDRERLQEARRFTVRY